MHMLGNINVSPKNSQEIGQQSDMIVFYSKFHHNILPDGWSGIDWRQVELQVWETSFSRGQGSCGSVRNQ